jgi:gamma-glutamyl hercynylcysteine S-oxide synthase
MELAETAAHADLRRQLASDLEDARKRTHRLLEPLDAERLTAQFDPLMSPPVWDYAHIGVKGAIVGPTQGGPRARASGR